jgi:nitroimidazol reductase NimA-like FMN-containing flavoprotein (pyridoxamine 5'-phosphate oxidase superfamily)
MRYGELTEAQIREVLGRARIGRLGCVRDGRPYVVPVYFAFGGEHVYGFSTFGRKIRWMRDNPHVCLEVDEIVDFNDWVSVIVFGRYEELTDAPELAEERRRASLLLDWRGKWLEPAYAASRFRDEAGHAEPIFYRILVDEATGRSATRAPGLL